MSLFQQKALLPVAHPLTPALTPTPTPTLTPTPSQAEEQLRTDVSAAVVTVPAYFDASQRNATKAACLLAGLERVRVG